MDMYHTDDFRLDVERGGFVEFLTIILRSLFIYFFVLLVMRLMGKREIGKLSVFDLVVSIMIADFAVLSIEDTKLPLFLGLLPIITMMTVQILLSWLSMKSSSIRHIVDGKPTILIKDGNIQEEEMKHHRYNLDDLMTQLREKNISNVAEVDFAILETSGKLSVFPKNASQGEPSQQFFLPLPLVIDGRIQLDRLEQIGKDREWLQNQLERYGYPDTDSVFFVSLDRYGRLYIDPKQDKD